MEIPWETGGGRRESAGAWRLLDAAANRAAEALRVLEDVSRFLLDDAHLTACAKEVRHELAAVLADPALACRSSCRDTPGDVGAAIVSHAPLPRHVAADLVAANAARGAQALRSLQEVALVLLPAAADRFERLRYRLYTLERALAGTLRASERLQGVSLCVLVDGRADAAAFEALVARLIEGGVRMIQLRDKRLPVPELLERGRRAVALARRQTAADVLVVVNDRADVAAAVGAAGVHVGADDLPAASARRVLGPGALVGRTAHSVEEARAAVMEGADYLGIGPCFPSPTKSFTAHASPAFLSGVVREIALPSFAIGGVTLERLDGLVALGIRRVAVASAITEAPEPAAAAAAFIERLARLPQTAP